MFPFFSSILALLSLPPNHNKKVFLHASLACRPFFKFPLIPPTHAHTLQRPVELLAIVPVDRLDRGVLLQRVAAQLATCERRGSASALCAQAVSDASHGRARAQALIGAQSPLGEEPHVFWRASPPLALPPACVRGWMGSTVCPLRARRPVTR